MIQQIVQQPVIVACPTCQRRLQVPSNHLGRPVRCGACRQTFCPSPESAEAPAPGQSPVPEQDPAVDEVLQHRVADLEAQLEQVLGELRDRADSHSLWIRQMRDGLPAPSAPGSAELSPALQQELAAARAQRDQLLAEVEALRARAAEVAQLEAKLQGAQAQHQRTTDVLLRELHVVRGERDRLMRQRRKDAAARAAHPADAERLRQLEVVRAERDRLAAQHQAAAQTLAQLQERQRELERRGAEEAVRHQEAHAVVCRELDEVRGFWEAERQARAAALEQVESLRQEAEQQAQTWETELQALRQLVEQEQQARSQAEQQLQEYQARARAEQRLSEELGRLRAERQEEQERNAALFLQLEGERRALTDQADSLRREMDLLRQERDAALEAVRAEAAALRAERDAALAQAAAVRREVEILSQELTATEAVDESNEEPPLTPAPGGGSLTPPPLPAAFPVEEGQAERTQIPLGLKTLSQAANTMLAPANALEILLPPPGSDVYD